MLKLNVNNETSRLLTVVLGTAKSNGSTPKLEECYDPKSRQNVFNNTYPTEIDMLNEMNQFEQVLLKYKVDIKRPETINNYNQIFSRDIAFVVDDSFIISNILPDRSNEILAINKVIDLIPKNKIIELPEDCHVEGGDVILHNDYIFIGTYDGDDYSNFKTARTNYKAIKFLKEKFRISFDNLFTLTNMPIKRFRHTLERKGELKLYQNLLFSNFNPNAAKNIMCKSLISISWDGKIYDCDFNQMLELPVANKYKSIFQLNSFEEVTKKITTKDHCFGCTAGTGSSCTGSLI